MEVVSKAPNQGVQRRPQGGADMKLKLKYMQTPARHRGRCITHTAFKEAQIFMLERLSSAGLGTPTAWVKTGWFRKWQKKGSNGGPWKRSWSGKAANTGETDEQKDSRRANEQEVSKTGVRERDSEFSVLDTGDDQAPGAAVGMSGWHTAEPEVTGGEKNQCQVKRGGSGLNELSTMWSHLGWRQSAPSVCERENRGGEPMRGGRVCNGHERRLCIKQV